MIKIIPSSKRFFSDMWNMNSYFLFNFANYYDPTNESFGNLRVFNDDFLEAKSWFDMHPHKYYEIMTIMLDWTITHKDSLWNNIKISKNQIQVTNTSTWIKHSEINQENKSLKLYQIWFSPPNMAEKPIYYTADFNEYDYKNNFFTLASWIEKNINKLSSKVSVKRWIFDAWKTEIILCSKNIFIYITKWKLKVNNNIILSDKFQLRASNEISLKIDFLEKSDVIIIESE